MPIRTLPSRPSLEHLRNEARDLQLGVHDGDPAALALAHEFHPRLGAQSPGTVRLSDAQLIIARSYGHRSWPRLKTYVDAVTDGQRALHIAAYEGDRAMCELLLRLGADPSLRDNAFDAPAAGWARHAHHVELADWLHERETD